LVCPAATEDSLEPTDVFLAASARSLTRGRLGKPVCGKQDRNDTNHGGQNGEACDPHDRKVLPNGPEGMLTLNESFRKMPNGYPSAPSVRHAECR
jgi:hypothetical protein